MLTACYEPVVNGVTQMVAQYERHLTAAGHQVTIFTLGEPASGEDASKVVRSPAMPLGKTGYYFAPRYSREAQFKLREVDVVHCHHLLMSLEFANRYSRRPVIFTNHTRYDLYLSAYARLPAKVASLVMQNTWRRLSGFADVVIAPSTSAQQLLYKAGVQVPVEVIENGVEIQRFRSPRRSYRRAEFGIPAAAVVFTYVGRLSREKNMGRLMVEFRQAARLAEDIHLVLVGDGPLQKKLERQIAADGLTDRVHFLGQATPEEVPAHLAISDVFASASLSEVHPLAVIEALVSGLPVVAIDSPGIGDVVEHDRSGLLVDGSPGSLAEAMSWLAKDSSVRHRLSAGAKLAGAGYDIQITVDRTMSLYRRLVRDQAGRISVTAARSGACRHPAQALASRFVHKSVFDEASGENSDGQ